MVALVTPKWVVAPDILPPSVLQPDSRRQRVLQHVFGTDRGNVDDHTGALAGVAARAHELQLRAKGRRVRPQQVVGDHATETWPTMLIMQLENELHSADMAWWLARLLFPLFPIPLTHIS